MLRDAAAGFGRLFVARLGDARAIDPAVVEVEEGADGDGVVDGLIAAANGVEGGDVRGVYAGAVVIDLRAEGEESLFGGSKRRVAEQDRRDRGVSFVSEETVIAFGGLGGDEFTEAPA